MAFLTNQKWYVGSTKYTAVAPWAALTVYAAGAVVRQLATPTVGNERCFVCIIAGTSLASEPTWVVTQGAKTAETAGPTWIEITGKAGVNGDLVDTNNWTSVKNTNVSQGVVIQRNSGGSLQVATIGGQTGNGAEPTFSNTAGVTTSDNAVTWTSLGAPAIFTAWAAPAARIDIFAAFGTKFDAPGDLIYLSNHHAETGETGNAAFPTLNSCFLSVDDSAVPPTALLTGATVTFSSVNNTVVAIGGLSSYWNGITFILVAGAATGGSFFVLGSGATTAQAATIFENCTFNLNTGFTNSFIGVGANTSSSSNNYIEFRACSFLFSSTSQFVSCCESNVRIIGGSFGASGSAPNNLFVGSTYATVYIQDCDLSNISSNLFFTNNQIFACRYFLENCKINAGVTITNGIQSQLNPGTVALHNSDSAATNYRYYFSAYAGVVQSETTIVRTGGATNGTTPESWNITTNANSFFQTPFESEEIAIWNDNSGSLKTATVCLASNSTLNNNDIWLEIEYPSSSSSPLGAVTTTRMAWLATPVALTADTSVWGGGVTNKYKFQLSFTPQMKGPIKARIYTAKVSTTVYVDPLITIT